MAVAKGSKSSPCSAICYKVRFLTEAILEATQIGYIEHKYVLGEQLGVGQFGVIRICRDRRTGEKLACKSIAKDNLVTLEDVHSVKLEIEIMARLSDHPNVVGLKSVFEDEDYVHLVMELCAGGDLYQMLLESGRFSEKEAAVLFRQLMDVLMYCHEKGVVHRDLKPENILLATTEMSSPIRLADFGLATYIKAGQSLHGIVGSPFYIAPEVLAGGYDEAVDVWSAGVILYILLSAAPPFWEETKTKIFDKVRAAELEFPSDPWDGISPSAKDLITGMLQKDPRKRLTAEQVLDHCWMRSHQEQLIRMSSSEQLLCVSNGGAILSDVQQELSVAFTGNSSFCSFSAADEVFSPSARYAFDGCGACNQDFSSQSFSFFGPCSLDEQRQQCPFSDNLDGSSVERDLSFGNMLTLSRASQPEAMKVERRESTVDSRATEMMNSIGRRNRTICLGEFELLGNLNFMVTGSLVRWSSFTNLSNAASLQPSLVC